MDNSGERLEATAFGALLAAAGTIAFSLPAGRAALAVGILLLAVDLVRRRRMPRLGAVSWLAAAFCAAAVAATVNGVHPELGLPKLRKLVWFLGVPLSATLVRNTGRLRRVLAAYALGTGVLALERCLVSPLRAAAAVRQGVFERFRVALVDQGSMTDGQTLMLGVVAVLALLRTAGRGRGRWLWPVLMALQVAALVVNFKRGSWLAALLLAGVFVCWKVNWRWLVAPAVAVAALLCVPWVRDRLGGLRREFDVDGGGRLTMWVRVTPALVQRYPMGVGFRSLTNEMMREVAPGVEPGRDHLHSNLAQVLVATGWLGLALYLAWMARAVFDTAAVAAAAVRRGGPAGTLSAALPLMLWGLLLNGLVEYNLADGELVIVYALIMGCAAGLLPEARGGRSCDRNSDLSPRPAA